uniref:Uncharacterized protein n=1 Tax=Cajanus cajan TaxID=3821 RepID=A0A151S3M5_CAJCA|nr:hypothetical protein KK1_028911 [Cajanus cajan]
MDSFQQPHGYMRPPQPPPPPPHTADPHHHPHHFHQIPPPPPQAPWFSSQFQYHPSQTPSPPPQWPQPPPQPPPPANAYSYHLNQFPPPPPPPPRSHVPPPQFTPHSHIPQPYPQEWSNPNWPPNQGYPAHNNEEDWAAKARAWADAKAAMESQHPQSHFSPAGRLQEQSHYHDQYQQHVDSHYADIQNQSHPSSSYQQFSYLDASAQRLSGHSQEAAPVSLETPYTSDGLSYSARDGTSIGDSTISFEQGNLPTNPSVHQQEVPSSYSSVAGKEAADHIQQSYSVFPLSSSTSQERHVQPSMHTPPFASGSHSVDSAISLADQPLDFAPRFNRDSDLPMPSTYNHHDSSTSMNNWAAPVTHGVGYPPIPPILASGQQHDPSITTPGHVAPPFGRFPGPGLSSTIPPSGAPFTLSSGTTIHPTTTFSADAYGVSGVPDRPKKASVPNWLREEIKKTVITAPAENQKEEATFRNDGIDKSYVRGDEADSKSIDSSRSAEDEDDDEDQVEAARTVAINQEIKRVLTEVLLKVTDELFDEIATKVLAEDDLTAEVGHKVATSNHKASASPLSATVPKASAKVLVPIKEKVENDGASEKSSSSSPGDVLGLGNYGSDADDGDNEIESSSVPISAKDAAYQSGIKKPLSDTHDVSVNGISQLDEHGRRDTNLVNNQVKTISLPPRSSNDAGSDQLHDYKVTRESNHSHSSKALSEDLRDNGLNAFERSQDRVNGFSSKDTSGTPSSELHGKNVSVEKATDDHPSRESRRKSEKVDRLDRSSEKDFVKEVHSSKTKTDEKGNENHRRKDERNQKREKTDYGSEAKERVKEHNLRHGEKAKESESRKRSSHVDVKDNKKEAEKSHRGSATDDTSRKREHAKDKGEHKSRQKEASNPDRHRRRRSSSVSSRGRTNKDHFNHAGDSSEGSDGSKRKLHSRKRDLSPSPVRSKRRQLSRSPHSKRSQRRHSPYSSLDSSRGRRSRSRSPVRRQR